MKKFLSLLLAMTMVMSLIVLPARATSTTTQGSITGEFSIKNGTEAVTSISLVKNGTGDDANKTSATLTPDISQLKLSNGTEEQASPTAEYRWTASPAGVVDIKYDKDTGSCTVTSLKSGKARVTCEVTLSKDTTVGENTTTVEAATSKYVDIDSRDPVGDANTAFGNAITLTYGDRPCKVVDNTYTGYKFADGETWKATVGTGFSINENNGIDTSVANKITVNGKNAKNEDVTVTFNTNVVNADVTVTSDINEVLAGGKVKLTATPNFPTTGLSVKYDWFYGTNTTITPDANGYWNVPSDATAGNYAVKCTVTVGKKSVTSSTAANITVATGDYTLSVLPPSVTIDRLNGMEGISAIFRVKNGKPVTEGVTYSFTSSNSSIATATQSSLPSAKNTATVKLVRSGNTSITVSAVFKGKTYTQTVNVYGTLLEATLSAVQNGATVNYSYSDLVTAAQTAINKNYYSSAYNYETVYTLSGVTPVANTTVYGVGTSNATYTYPTGSGYLSFTAGLTNIGTAKFTANVSTRTTAGSPKSYSITFNVPVKPTATTYADQYPEPVASYGNTYRYYVQVPADAKYYYVAGVNNEPSDWNNGSGNKYYTTTSSTSLYSLTDSNFTNGKCTLYVVTQGTDNKLYCGTITVYQKNHDIKYNGVVGNTVQFKHNDFTTFMNEMYGTNTTSYLTFNSVKFTSVPNATSQGTLYYSGSAMTTGYGSNYFNTNTAVANLDNVSFAVSSRVPSTTKEIRIPFTLYATRYNSYGSYGTGSGTSVTYSGAVVISLVREDVTFTVAPGDAVTFTDSAFLNYLRAQSGINYNYNIDYVTFDQSAVDTINGGVLYSGYAGYNQVKTTDKFYYSATNNYTQNALSDVTFRASLYAKTGTTVYIPFTIYAKYGTSGAVTRQVTGTVAVKIAQTMNFVDVKPTDYFYNPVKWAVGKNITKGTSAVTFSPDKTCTRAEIVTFLWRDAGSPMPTISRNPFTDVSYSMGADFYNAILWASQNGITAGTSTTTFSPNKNCTRAEIVTFLWRYAKKPVGYGSNSFTDVNKTDHAPYYDAILWAVSKGITNGSTTTTFAPNDTCTRAQAVTFLYRYEGGK